MPEVEDLLASRSASVLAAAGCGKTHLIARAVREDEAHRSLVLTHTHAGVDALRIRLREFGATPGQCALDTIAGWCLRLAGAFPATSGVITARPTADEWAGVYRGTRRLLEMDAIRAVVGASYDVVYVDEYQDCSKLQHEVVVGLSQILPTRVFGDPLQGIFGFRNDILVDWASDVVPSFPALDPLTVPHRWAETRPSLGEWLSSVRVQLVRSEPIDLSTAPPDAVTTVTLPTERAARSAAQRAMCSRASCPEGETLVAIHSWEGQCHDVSRRTGGKFRSLETMECEELFRFAKRFDDARDGRDLASGVFDFSSTCLTKVGSALRGTVQRILDGRGLQAGRAYQYDAQLRALSEVVAKGSLSAARSALLVLRQLDGVREARQELYREMLAALREHGAGAHESLEKAAIRSRDRTRRGGRTLTRYVVARTLLIKGLQFDHALILDADALDAKNLYVAFTRPCRSLTVMAGSQVLAPH